MNDARDEDFGMTPTRRRVLSAFFLFVIAGHAFDIVAKRDDWPFSRYPMYAVVRPSVVERDDVVGVGAEGEFELRVPHHLAPFDVTRLRWVLNKIEKKREHRYSEALDRLFDRYEDLRAAGKHSGPPILALRTYRTAWTIKSRAVNRDTPDWRSLKFYAQRITPALAADLEQQRGDKPQAPHALATGDVVVNAEAFTPSGHTVLDQDAGAGSVLLLRTRKGQPSDETNGAEVTVNVAPGRYHVWLRGRAAKKATRDSVWLRATSGGTLRCWSDTTGLGNWHERFDPTLYAWSGTAPGAPPCVLDAKQSTIQLRIWLREGPVMIDQLWLSRQQSQPPAFARAVAAAGTTP